MDENTFWMGFWKIAVAGVAVLAVSIASCTANTNYQKRLVLEKGVDPLLVACAFEFDASLDVVCAVAAARERK